MEGHDDKEKQECVFHQSEIEISKKEKKNRQGS